MGIQAILDKKGPRKLLALDGGGIRGIITIEILARIETTLRKKFNCGPKFVLADYFDYIAGTSTGAIIATCLALGMSVDQIREFYLKSSREMFDRARLWERFKYKYRDEKLSQMLKNVIGENTTLGSDRVKTLLMMVMRNATTDSPWPLSNNPAAKYCQRNHPGCNLDLPLWQLVRASTAAPVYFPPETIVVGEHEFIFVDGGVTMYNNPAFQLFLMATTAPYNLNWSVGENQMLLVSIGTGASNLANPFLSPGDLNLISNAQSIPSALMHAALSEQDFLCRTFGKCLCGDSLDREIGRMMGRTGPIDPKLFTYVRYNLELSQKRLRELGIEDIDAQTILGLDSIDRIPELQRVGQTTAGCNVDAKHFNGFAL